MGDYGIKVTKVGVDITDTDVRNVIFSSKYSMLKYHSENTGNLTIPSGTYAGSVDFSHALGYVPVFIAYVKYTWYDAYQRIMPQGRAGQPVVITAYATSAKVTCRVNQIWQASARTYYFRVIIFKDKIV